MAGQKSIEPFEIEVFFDGGCPLCSREIKWLRRKDIAGRIKFTDIDDPSFDVTVVGKSIDELLARMHGRLPDGAWLCGVEVFRRIYSAIGFRWMVFVSQLPVISQVLHAGYWLFAKYRVGLTGRCSRGGCSVQAVTACQQKTPPSTGGRAGCVRAGD